MCPEMEAPVLEWIDSIVDGRSLNPKEKSPNFRKQQIMYDCLAHEDVNLENWAEDVAKEIDAAESICIVGNGKVESMKAAFVDAHDYVIRCNDYRSVTSVKAVGSKVNLHITCLKTGYLEWRPSDATFPTVAFDRFDRRGHDDIPKAVSYTHLTLPTILLV